MSANSRALALVAPASAEPTKVLGWACPECHALFTDSRGAEFAAECCPKPCQWGAVPCTQKALRHKLFCEVHTEVHRAGREKERYEKARKIPDAEYEGLLFWHDGHGGTCGDNYYRDWAEILEHCEEVGIDPPPYVYGCTKKGASSDAGQIVSSALEEFHEDAADGVSAEQMTELQTMLDAWWARANIQSWDTDYETVVLPPLDHVVQAPEAEATP